MCGIKKCSTIIYRLKKYRDTSIPRYFVTSSIVDNFCKIQSYESSECSRRFSAIYVIDTICKLSASGRGCHVDGIYAGVLMYYPDDPLLNSSTGSDLRRVTKICEDEMK